VLPRGDGTQGRVQFAEQSVLVAVLRPEPVLAVAQVRVAKADGTTWPAEGVLRVVARRGHGVLGRTARAEEPETKRAIGKRRRRPTDGRTRRRFAGARHRGLRRGPRATVTRSVRLERKPKLTGKRFAPV